MAREISEKDLPVICDVMDRVMLSEVRNEQILNEAVAGSLMLSMLHKDFSACMVALDDKARIVAERRFLLGPKWLPPGFIKELLSFMRRSKKRYLLLGVSRDVNTKEIFSFDAVYRALEEQGIIIVDIIEVRPPFYRSIMNSVNSSHIRRYREFSDVKMIKPKNKKTPGPK